MGKHEIRLRRKMMTSRRIERHKNYAGLMDKHHKTQRTRTIVRWVIIVLVFIMSVVMMYNVVEKNNFKISQIENAVNLIEPLTFEIIAEDGDTINIHSGSEIHIPKYAFQDEKGMLVSGKVTILYKEHRNPFEIALAGINMQLDSITHLESAGMFTFKASQNGNTVFPNPKSVIKVIYLTKEHEKGFNNYLYNEKTTTWDEISPEIVKTRFQIMGNYKGFPELKYLRGVVWEFQNESLSHKQDSLFNTTITSFELKKEDNGYTIEVCFFPYDIIPVIISLANGSDSVIYQINSSSDYACYIKTYLIDAISKNVDLKYNKYRQALINRRNHQKVDTTFIQELSLNTITQRDMVMNSFYLTGFGTWNCDRPFPIDKYETVSPTFVQTNGNKIEQNDWFLISTNLNTVFRFQDEPLKVSKNQDYTIFGLINDSTLLYKKQADFFNKKLILESKTIKNILPNDIKSVLGFELTTTQINDPNDAARLNSKVLVRPDSLKDKNVIWVNDIDYNDLIY